MKNKTSIRLKEFTLLVLAWPMAQAADVEAMSGKRTPAGKAPTCEELIANNLLSVNDLKNKSGDLLKVKTETAKKEKSVSTQPRDFGEVILSFSKKPMNKDSFLTENLKSFEGPFTEVALREHFDIEAEYKTQMFDKLLIPNAALGEKGMSLQINQLQITNENGFNFKEATFLKDLVAKFLFDVIFGKIRTDYSSYDDFVADASKRFPYITNMHDFMVFHNKELWQTKRINNKAPLFIDNKTYEANKMRLGKQLDQSPVQRINNALERIEKLGKDLFADIFKPGSFYLRNQDPKLIPNFSVLDLKLHLVKAFGFREKFADQIGSDLKLLNEAFTPVKTTARKPIEQRHPLVEDLAKLLFKNRLSPQQQTRLTVEEAELAKDILQIRFLDTVNLTLSFNKEAALDRMTLLIKPTEKYINNEDFNRLKQELIFELFPKHPDFFKPHLVDLYPTFKEAFKNRSALNEFNELVKEEVEANISLQLLDVLIDYVSPRSVYSYLRDIDDRIKNQTQKGRALNFDSIKDLFEKERGKVNHFKKLDAIKAILKKHYTVLDNANRTNEVLSAKQGANKPRQTQNAMEDGEMAMNDYKLLFGPNFTEAKFDSIVNTIKSEGIVDREGVINVVKDHGFNEALAEGLFYSPFFKQKAFNGLSFSSFRTQHSITYEQLSSRHIGFIKLEAFIKKTLVNRGGPKNAGFYDSKLVTTVMAGLLKQGADPENTAHYGTLLRNIEQAFDLPVRSVDSFLFKQSYVESVRAVAWNGRKYWDPSIELKDSVANHPLVGNMSSMLSSVSQNWPNITNETLTQLFTITFRAKEFSEVENMLIDTFNLTDASKLSPTIVEPWKNIFDRIHEANKVERNNPSLLAQIKQFQVELNPKLLLWFNNIIATNRIFQTDQNIFVTHNFFKTLVTLQENPSSFVRVKRMLLNQGFSRLETHQMMTEIMDILAPTSAFQKSALWGQNGHPLIKQLMLIAYEPPIGLKINRLEREETITVNKLKKTLSDFNAAKEQLSFKKLFSSLIRIGFGRDDIALAVKLGLLDAFIKTEGKSIKLIHMFPRINEVHELVGYSILSRINNQYKMPLDFKWVSLFYAINRVREIRNDDFRRIENILMDHGISKALAQQLIRDGNFDVKKIEHRLGYGENRMTKSQVEQKEEFLQLLRESPRQLNLRVDEMRELEADFMETGELGEL